MGSNSGATGRASGAHAAAERNADRGLTLVAPEAVGSLATHPLPPVPAPEPESGPGPLGLVVAGPASPAPAPSWSPLWVALPLFAAVWLCFGVLSASVTVPPAADVARLAGLLSTGVCVVALVLLTLSVAHTQVSGLPPRPAVLGTLALGAGQALACVVIGTGLWGIAARVFALVAVAVPLAWVGGQFQSGVRRQRAERDSSLIASFTDRARRQAQATVDSVHRHDVRSMLFVIEGATRVLGDPNLPADQRASFTQMLDESLGRLGALADVRTEEIQPFDVADVVRAVAHAERRAGRTLVADVPAGSMALGRSADLAAVLRTLSAITGSAGPGGIQMQVRVQAQADVKDGAVVLVVGPGDAEVRPLLSRNWDEIRVDSFKISSRADDTEMNLFVAARLLAEQGADLWSTAGRVQFAVRLSVPPDLTTEELG